MVVNVTILVQCWRQSRVVSGIFLLVPALFAMPILAVGIRFLNMQFLTILAGSLTILCSLSLLSNFRIKQLRGIGGAIVASITSAAMNLIGGISGPAIALYTVNADWPSDARRPTMQIYNLGINLATLLTLGIPSLSIAIIPCLAILSGGAVSSMLIGRFNTVSLKYLTLGLAIIGGILIIIKSII
jgi:hypothetical protein